MTRSPLSDSILASWRTNCRVTAFIVDSVPNSLWSVAIPGSPRRTMRMLVAHLHNARARWIRTLGKPHGIPVPPLVDLRRVNKRVLLASLRRSEKGIADILSLGLQNDGTVPASPAYVWRNLPLDVGHVLSYFVAHEAHHRGQIVLIARHLGERLPASVTNGLWQWTSFQKGTAPWPSQPRRRHP